MKEALRIARSLLADSGVVGDYMSVDGLAR